MSFNQCNRLKILSQVVHLRVPKENGKCKPNITIAGTEMTNAPERCLKTSTSTCLVFNVTLDMMAPINSKKQ